MAFFRLTSALAIVALALAGCAGGGSQRNNALPQVGTGAPLQITIKIPSSSTSSASRRPQYISASTQSITVAMDGGTAQAYGLTPASPGCAAASGNVSLTCTINLSLSVGGHTATFTTYDGANGSGDVLSTVANVPITIKPGQTNTFDAVLNGTIGSLNSLCTCHATLGTPATFTMTIEAYDAQGNLIIGPGTYANGPITPTDTDISGVTSLSPTTIGAPGTTGQNTVTLTYSGAAIPGGYATIGASIGTAGGSFRFAPSAPPHLLCPAFGIASSTSPPNAQCTLYDSLNEAATDGLEFTGSSNENDCTMDDGYGRTGIYVEQSSPAACIVNVTDVTNSNIPPQSATIQFTSAGTNDHVTAPAVGCTMYTVPPNYPAPTCIASEPGYSSTFTVTANGACTATIVDNANGFFSFQVAGSKTPCAVRVSDIYGNNSNFNLTFQ